MNVYNWKGYFSEMKGGLLNEDCLLSGQLWNMKTYVIKGEILSTIFVCSRAYAHSKAKPTFLKKISF